MVYCVEKWNLMPVLTYWLSQFYLLRLHIIIVRSLWWQNFKRESVESATLLRQTQTLLNILDFFYFLESGQRVRATYYNAQGLFQGSVLRGPYVVLGSWAKVMATSAKCKALLSPLSPLISLTLIILDHNMARGISYTPNKGEKDRYSIIEPTEVVLLLLSLLFTLNFVLDCLSPSWFPPGPYHSANLYCKSPNPTTNKF